MVTLDDHGLAIGVTTAACSVNTVSPVFTLQVECESKYSRFDYRTVCGYRSTYKYLVPKIMTFSYIQAATRLILNQNRLRRIRHVVVIIANDNSYVQTTRLSMQSVGTTLHGMHQVNIIR